MRYATEQERKQAHLQQSREYRLRHPDRVREAKERWRKKNMDRYALYSKKWRDANPELRKIVMATWAQRNKATLNANKTRRLAARQKATPSWADLEAIETFYREAQKLTRETGVPHSVDHIVPLTSRLVCGLHVEHNLRVIPHAENLSKKNYHWPDMP